MVPGALRIAIAALALLVTTVGCTTSEPPSGRMPVVAAFYPLAEFSRAVGGDRVEVHTLVPGGVEPHDYDPTPRDMERTQRARLLVYIGSGFQPGLEKAIAATDTPNRVAIDVLHGDGMELLAAQEEDEDGHAPDGTADEHNEGMDPHVWLDPVQAQHIVGQIRDALIQIDPSGQDTYTANAQQYLARLDQLDREYRQGLASCARRDFVSSHAAFSYVAHRYALTQVPISGLSPEAEPSPARLRQIVEETRRRQAKVIFFETLVNPKVAEVIAREIGAQTLVLNPIEGLTGEEERQGKGYLDLMRQNLANLRIALECR